jgi:hypothetical protein
MVNGLALAPNGQHGSAIARLAAAKKVMVTEKLTMIENSLLPAVSFALPSR